MRRGSKIGLDQALKRVHPRPQKLGTRAWIEGKHLRIPGQAAPFDAYGVNFGAWAEEYPNMTQDTANFGSRVVRYPLRWKGLYGGAGIDSRDTAAYAQVNAINFNKWISDLKAIAAAGMWSIPGIDSNCVQDGTQSTSMRTYCDPQGLYPSGANFIYDLNARAAFRMLWKHAVQELKYVNNVLALELLPEPLNGRDATYAAPLLAFLRELCNDIDSVDGKYRTLKMVGPRDAYNPLYFSEVLMADRPDIYYTGNCLSNKTSNLATLPTYLQNFTSFRDTSNVPVNIDQLGRKSSTDPNLYIMRAALFMVRAMGIHQTWWQNTQNTTALTEYGLHCPDGLGGWVTKANEVALIQEYSTMTFASVESTAIAAAQAAGAVLFYVKNDFSNCWQDPAGTEPVITTGQRVSLMTPVVGSGITLGQNTLANAPLTVALTNGYGLQFDGVQNYMDGSSPFFSSGDDMTVIFAGTPPGGTNILVGVHGGSGQTAPRYPYMAYNSAKVAYADWRGDDNVDHATTGTTTLAAYPVVMSAVKIGNTKKIYVNGVQEGATESNPVGSIASITRLRIGCDTSQSHFWSGPVSLICLCKGGMTDAQRVAIARLGAFLLAAAFQQ